MRDLEAAIRNQPPAEHPYDWDPIHMPGSVQGYGVLLVAEKQTRRVIFASENAGQMLGIAAADIVDRPYLALTEDERERRELRERISPDTILFPNPMRLTIRGRPFDAVFHAEGETHLIELEPVPAGAAAFADMADRAVEEMFEPGSVEELYQRAVRVVREVTGFDRVMLYRFDARYNGQVLAESTREGIGSFLGLFFPSSDIGGRVRELYLRNFTRYIPDIAAPPHPLVGVHPGAGRAGTPHAVDMSQTNLRSVIPCHVDYLRNMGVRASISFSINVDNRLWGLFACHHYAPRPVSFEQRVVCEQTAMMFIFKLGQLTSVAARIAQRAEGVRRIAQTASVGATLSRRLAAVTTAWEDAEAQSLARPMLARALGAVLEETCWLTAPEGAASAPADPHAPLTASQKTLLSLVEADSAAVVRHGVVRRIGEAPADMTVFAIASMFGRELPDLRGGNLPVFATDCLAAIVPAAEEVKDRAAGVLALSLSDETPALLLFFRREQIVHATWAGNPAAEAIGSTGGRFTPRGSFAAWKEDIRNLSRPWVIEDVETAYELGQALRAATGGTQAVAPAFAPTGWRAPAPPSVPQDAPVSTATAQAAERRSRHVIRVGEW